MNRKEIFPKWVGFILVVCSIFFIAASLFAIGMDFGMRSCLP